jgi:hypothetical protein
VRGISGTLEIVGVVADDLRCWIVGLEGGGFGAESRDRPVHRHYSPLRQGGPDHRRSGRQQPAFFLEVEIPEIGCGRHVQDQHRQLRQLRLQIALRAFDAKQRHGIGRQLDFRNVVADAVVQFLRNQLEELVGDDRVGAALRRMAAQLVTLIAGPKDVVVAFKLGEVEWRSCGSKICSRISSVVSMRSLPVGDALHYRHEAPLWCMEPWTQAKRGRLG